VEQQSEQFWRVVAFVVVLVLIFLILQLLRVAG
jgi:hypothetical protein